MDGLGNHENEPYILTEVQLNFWLAIASLLSPAHVEAIKEQHRRQLANMFGSKP